MDTIQRYPGETDAELRVRIIDIPIAKEARAAIWRVFDKPNKDAPKQTWTRMGSQMRISIGGVHVATAGQGDYTLNIPTDINVLGRFEPEEK